MFEDQAAEQQLLSAALGSEEVQYYLVRHCRLSDFATRRHAVIARAIRQLVADNKHVALVMVKDLLEQQGLLEAAGGLAYLAELQTAAAAPTLGVAEHYGRKLRELALRRHLLRAGDKLRQLAAEEREAEALLSQAQDLVMRLTASDGCGGAELVGDGLWSRWVEHKSPQPMGGLLTGFTKLDQYLGGLKAGELIVLAGRPSMGKTALALNIALNVAHDQKRVLLLSLEMSSAMLSDRLISLQTGLDSHRLRRKGYDEADLSRGEDKLAAILTLPLFIDDTPAAKTADIRAEAHRLRHRYGLDLVVVDYLQLIGDTRKGGISTNDHVGQVTLRLQQLARDLDVPVILLSQLNRSVELRGDRRPQLSDLRDSGTIEQAADVVLMVFRQEYYTREKAGLAEVIIAKQRNGPIGSCELYFDKKTGQFMNGS